MRIQEDRKKRRYVEWDAQEVNIKKQEKTERVTH